MHIDALKSLIEEIADPGLAADWDRSGLQIAGQKNEIRKLAVTLDPSEAAVHEALSWKADFILTHHPLTLAPRLPSTQDAYTSVLRQVLSCGCWLYAAHTSLDVATFGPVSWLAKALGLKHARPVDPMPAPGLVKIVLSGIDPGQEPIKHLKGTEPVYGIKSKNGDLEVITRKKETDLILKTLRQFFREGSVELTELTDLKPRFGYGVIGDLSSSLSWKEFHSKLSSLLQRDHLLIAGSMPQRVSQVAYCPGSGMSLASKAFALGAEVFVSGDLKFHQAQELENLGLTIDAGHFLLEERMMAAWSTELASTLANKIQVRFIPGRDPLKAV